MIEVTIIFGEEAVREYNETGKIPSEEWLLDNGGVVDTKRFKSQELYEAYCEGVSDCEGWNSSIILEPIINIEEEKELFAFLYPLEQFERNVTDDEILGGWADGYVEKYTPDEFAAILNDENFANQAYWVRFIKC